MRKIRKIDLYNFDLEQGKQQEQIELTYQTFGQPIGSAPVVVVNHSMSGSANVCGRNGWWNGIVGPDKTIDTHTYTIIAFNIPGNGQEKTEASLLTNYRDFTVRDMASLFWEGLFQLNIKKIFAVIGGGLGGAIAWEMGALQPNKIEHLIPIGSDWKATDKIIANVLLQDQILNLSDEPLTDARYWANLYYKNSDYVNQIFKRENLETSAIAQTELCVLSQNKCKLAGYRLMNHLLRTHDITRNRLDFRRIANTIKANIHVLAIDARGLFSAEENRLTFLQIKKVKKNVYFHEIQSNYGEEAYLKESHQLANLLLPVFKAQNLIIRQQFSYASSNLFFK